MGTFRVSQEIQIMRKPNIDYIRYGSRAKYEEINANTYQYLSAGLTNAGEPLRGLDPEEEAIFLKKILGVSPIGEVWEKATKNYWNDIQVPIPSGIGRKIEIGFDYKSEADHDKCVKEIDKFTSSFANQNDLDDAKAKGFYFTEVCKIKQKYGDPINIADYVLYRFAVKSNKVANEERFVSYSKNIMFFVYSKDIEIQKKASQLKLRTKASTVLLELFGNKTKKEQILTMFNINPDYLNSDEQDIELEILSKEQTDEFIAKFNDPKLKEKAKLETYVRMGILRRVPNTQTVFFGNDKLGDSSEEVLIFLDNPKNKRFVDDIEAKAVFNKQMARVNKPTDNTGSGDFTSALLRNSSDDAQITKDDSTDDVDTVINNIDSGGITNSI